MIPCLMVCQAFICLVLGGQTDKVYSGSLEDDGDKNGIQAIESENQVHVGFEPSSVRAFLPARSCHVTFNNDFGTFSPPVFFGQIDVNLWCNWTILAAPGKHIVIYIDGFHTNTNCDDNDDEIIFERITSSIETAIVPACLNKPRHVFAAQAMAVNVVLLWRTFPHTGSSKYFEGRYYIFDDPAAGLNDHSCNCSLKPYKSMTKTAVTTVPKGPPTNLLPVFSSVSPILSTSKLPNISTTVSEIHYDQEQPATTTPEIYYDEEQPATTTPQSPLHIGYNLTAGTLAISLLKDVQSTVVQAPSPPSEALQPPSSYRSFPSIDEDKLTDGETTGDLQPSYVGQWEPTSSSEWTKGKSLSLSETPQLSTAHTDISVTPYFSGAQYSELHVTPHFSTTYPTDLPVTLDYDTTHVAKLPKATLSIHYTAKLPKTPHFGISHTKLDVTKQISTKNIHVPMSTHVNDALFFELAEIYNFSKGQFASAFVTPPVSATLQKELPQNYVTSIVKRTKLPKSSHINKEEITETPKTILNLLNIESHLEKPTSVPPLSWQRPLSAVNATIKHVISSDMHKIETSTTFSPVQFTSLPDEKIIANQVGTHVLKSSALLPTTKSLSKEAELDSQTAREPLEKSQVFHPVSLSTIHPEYNLHKAKPTTSVQGIQMNVFHSSYSTSPPSAIETATGFSPQKVLVLGQEILHPSYQPKFEVKPMLFESLIQVTKAEKEMDVTKKNVSKITEIQTLPTEKNKSSELFPRFVGLIGHWFRNPSLHDSGRESKTTTQHVTSTAMPHKSSSTQVLISVPLSPLHSPTNNSHQSPDVAIIKGTKMAASDQDHSTVQSNKSHANDHFDLNQKKAGQPRINDFDISENQTDLGFPHQPGDSLFKITAEIQHRNVKLKKWKKERIEIVKAKIIEKIAYVPSGINSLLLKDVTLTNPKKLTLTFWLHLQVGGKGVRNSITTQVKALEGQLNGTVGATLVSLSVEDVNECQLGIQHCDANAECANEFGSYTCQCMKGYEDHSPAAPGTVCITPRLAEVYSLSGQMEILVASIGGVAITLLLLILLLCIVQLTRHSKANFILRKGPRESQDARFAGALHASHGECGQMMPSIEGHMSPRQSKEQHTARDTSSNLQLTNITFEQTAC